MLKMLARFDLGSLFREQPLSFYHCIAEAMKLAFADRAFWLGDSDHIRVPRGLLDDDYCRRLAERIQLEAVGQVDGAGKPDLNSGFFQDKKHTTHLTTVDRDGNWVAMTATVNTSFGSKLIVPGTGVILNNQMDDFSIAPGVPNAFGLVGTEQNAIGPGKRPLSSMSPTIVLDEQDRPIVTCGAAGGPRIITATLLHLIRVLDIGQPIDEAIASPRIHHQWRPSELSCETALEINLVEGLRGLGHDVKLVRTSAIAQGIQQMSDGQRLAASDPRTDGQAIAVG